MDQLRISNLKIFKIIESGKLQFDPKNVLHIGIAVGALTASAVFLFQRKKWVGTKNSVNSNFTVF